MPLHAARVCNDGIVRPGTIGPLGGPTLLGASRLRVVRISERNARDKQDTQVKFGLRQGLLSLLAMSVLSDSSSSCDDGSSSGIDDDRSSAPRSMSIDDSECASSSEDAGGSSEAPSSNEDTGSSGEETTIRGKVWEICCSPTSTIVKHALKQGLDAERITLETGYDFFNKTDMRRAWRRAKAEGVRKAWAAVPCTVWSSLQNMNQRTEKQRERLKWRRLAHRGLLQNVLDVLLAVVMQGGDIYFEWPNQCSGWSLQELQDFRLACERMRRPLITFQVHGCMYGLKSIVEEDAFLKKCWVIWTTDHNMARGLKRSCNAVHRHVRIQGRDSKHSGWYPDALGHRIATIWRASL